MSEEIIARYCFLPWLRHGIATRISMADNLGIGASGVGERASLDISLRINDGGPIAQQVLLFGPGDVVGIDPRAVVRTDPKNWVTDFEPNYLPAIEFYDEDFPWRYTPASAVDEHRLRPWITLIVLKENDEFRRVENQVGPLPAIRLEAGAPLPNPTEVWAWAHVQVNGDLLPRAGDSMRQALDNLNNLLRRNPDLAVSRLICPRRLEANTPYYAFVIPTFETGRRAGLGLPIPQPADGLKPAWGDGQNEFPIYYEWYFRTGERGDFEYLVRLLQPRALDSRIGTREMDVQNPGSGVTGISAPPTLVLEGALRSAQTESTPWTNREPFQSELTRLINLPEEIQVAGAESAPIVTPPLYGRWHALVRRLRATGNPRWIEQLNLDPRPRVAAGIGTLVVQQKQEELMASAWRQVGNILEANRRLQRAQLAREASLSLFQHHFTTLNSEVLLTLTSPVHTRVLGSPVTIRQLMKDSLLPVASVSSAFRRLTRPRGPIIKKLNPHGEKRPGYILGRINKGEITPASAKTAPPKIIALDDVSKRLISSWLPEWLKPLLGWIQWIMLALVLLVLLNLAFNFISFTNTLFIALAGGAAFLYLQSQRSRIDAAENLLEGNLTPAEVARVPLRPNFSITQPGESVAAPGSSGQDSVEAANFRSALTDLHTLFQESAQLAQPAAGPVFNFEHAQTSLLDALNPATSIHRRVLSFINIPASYLAVRDDLIEPVMAAPDFPQPMYVPLRNLSSDWLIPNVNLIQQNTIALLQTNRPFIEAYMVGLNHEMARELLWREFPTDQRGSYFRQFWGVSDSISVEPGLTEEQRAERLRDIKPIHMWRRGANLGENNNRPLDEEGENLMLVIRGDLLKKYPTAVIYAVNAEWPAGRGARQLGSSDKYPIFHAEIEPDLSFLGFDLALREAKGSDRREDGQPGWYFVIKERPGETRFGLDAAEGSASVIARSWDDLSWGHIAAPGGFNNLKYIELSLPLHNVDVRTSSNPDRVNWGTQAADMAHILYQAPMLIAIHASEMLPFDA